MSGHCVVNSWTSSPSTTISLVSLSPKWCPNSVNVSVVGQWARLPFKSTMHTMCKTLALQFPQQFCMGSLLLKEVMQNIHGLVPHTRHAVRVASHLVALDVHHRVTDLQLC